MSGVIIVNTATLPDGRIAIDIYENGEHQVIALTPRALKSLKDTLAELTAEGPAARWVV